MQDPLHFLHFPLRNLQLIDNAGRIRVFAERACVQIFLNEPPVQRIGGMLTAEAVHLRQIPGKRDRSMVIGSLRIALNESGKQRSRIRKQNKDRWIACHLQIFPLS
ncbi:hypothetical protein D3C73_1114340 [compost metagenome]